MVHAKQQSHSRNMERRDSKYSIVRRVFADLLVQLEAKESSDIKSDGLHDKPKTQTGPTRLRWHIQLMTRATREIIA